MFNYLYGFLFPCFFPVKKFQKKRKKSFFAENQLAAAISFSKNLFSPIFAQTKIKNVYK